MKLTKFQIEDDKIFQGFSDGTTCNGWSNPYFTLEVAKEVLEYYQNQSCEESRQQWLDWKLEVDKTFMGIDLYYFGGGYIWSEVTEEDEKRIKAIDEYVKKCQKYPHYLRDICTNYYDHIENN